MKQKQNHLTRVNVLPLMQDEGQPAQSGFSLIELMVVLAILGVLFGISSGAWGQYLENTRVDSAKEQIVSLFQQARLKALSSGSSQEVVFNHPSNTAVSALGQNYSFDDVDVQKFSCSTCTASDPVALDRFTFKRRATGNSKSLKVSSANAGKTFFLVVSGVTGRIKVATQCVAPNCS